MERNVLGADPRTFSAVGAASGHMECADDVNIFSSKESYAAFWETPESGLSKNAVGAGAGGTYVAAGVAANALGKLASQNSKRSSGVRASSFATVSKRSPFQESSISLSTVIISSYTTWVLRQTVQRSRRASLPCHGLVAVESMYRQGVSVLVDRGDTLDSHGADFSMSLSAAENTDNVGLFSVDAVLF